jgi:hypothetical protein
MKYPPIQELTDFIVCAKATTYVGSGKKSLSYRPGALDLQFHDGDFAYLDSYFGGTDFIGQEVVYFESNPVWVMNYYGYILQPDMIEAVQAGNVIKLSLQQLYKEGRFLGGFEHRVDEFLYTDANEGDVVHFQGKEWINRDDVRVYELIYHGGLVK